MVGLRIGKMNRSHNYKTAHIGHEKRKRPYKMGALALRIESECDILVKSNRRKKTLVEKSFRLEARESDLPINTGDRTKVGSHPWSELAEKIRNGIT